MSDKSLNEKTYNMLKMDIMTFKLKPGEVISAQKIAEIYDVSRTPAREAIVTLAKEGLLDIIPKSGSRVSKIDFERASQEWFVRTNLEIGMVNDFIKNCDEKVIERLENQLKKLTDCENNENVWKRIILDNQFHGIIYECSGQLLAKEIIDTQMTHYNRLRFLAETNKKIQQMSDSEHIMLIEAAKLKDKAKYIKIIKKHMSRIEKDKIEIFKLYPEYFEQ